MNDNKLLDHPRRSWLRAMSGVAVAAPLAMFTKQAFSAQNAVLRQALKYQDMPLAGKQCATCAQFVPGKTPKDLGGCTTIPGDTEISPNGYCVAWIEAKKK